MRSTSLRRGFPLPVSLYHAGPREPAKPSSHGNQKQAAEREEGSAAGPRGIGARDPRRVLGLETGALRFLEAVEERLERRSAGPLDDRIRALQNVEVLGLPDVEVGDVRSQDVVIEGR